MVNLNKIYFLFVIIFIHLNISYSYSHYYLCGPDEDGCSLDQTQHCACIPHDEINATQRYCLDFNELKCYPLSEVPSCPTDLIFKDQGRCLATIFQSEPEPPCPMTTRDFCFDNNIYICDIKGNPRSCNRPH